jgi:hypoxanthine phosphoribosyltransferase
MNSHIGIAIFFNFAKEEPMAERLVITSPQYDQLIYDLYQKVKQSKIEFDQVAAIARGGLAAGIALSYALDLPWIFIGAAHWPKEKKMDDKVRFSRHAIYIEEDKLNIKGNVLLVDDLSDTGLSLVEGKIYLRKKFPNIGAIMTATLFHKTCSALKPDFYALEIGRDENGEYPWIVQPLEEIELLNHRK